MIPAMDRVGDLFQKGDYFLPEMLIAARAMKEGMKVLKPVLVQRGTEMYGKVILGTVRGDMHDIGKNLVCMMLEGAGYEVIDLGVNVETEKFVAAAKDQGAKLLALSALLTTTMGAMKETVDAVKAAGLNDQVKLMIGGAPVTQSFADEIGADGYAADAASAVDVADQLLELL